MVRDRLRLAAAIIEELLDDAMRRGGRALPDFVIGGAIGALIGVATGWAITALIAWPN